MHQAVVDDHFGSKTMANALMSEAHTQQRSLSGVGFDDLVGKTRFAGRTGPGRNQNPLRLFGIDRFQGNLVVAMDLHLNIHFSQILDQVVSKGIVIVDDEQHRSKRARTLGRLNGCWIQSNESFPFTSTVLLRLGLSGNRGLNQPKVPGFPCLRGFFSEANHVVVL